jgi:hypothetical protein
MKIVMLLLLMFTSFFSNSKNQTQDFEPLNLGKVHTDFDTIKQQMDSTAHYINATYEILVLEYKQFGLIETIRMNSGIFLPFLALILIYLFWKRNRKRC